MLRVCEFFTATLLPLVKEIFVEILELLIYFFGSNLIDSSQVQMKKLFGGSRRETYVRNLSPLKTDVATEL